jgi:hypothetical protein
MRNCIVAILLAAISLRVLAAEPPRIIRGQLPEYSYPDLESKVGRIWEFAQTNVGVRGPLEPPIVYFCSFSPKAAAPEWQEWQRKWVSAHPEIWDDWRRNNPGSAIPADGNPFPEHFFAFHYDGTNRIQVNPHRTFLPFYVNAPDGTKQDYTGAGYYSTGHELHHYALESLGVPGPLHHCLFIKDRPRGRKSMMEALADFLVEQNISASIIYHMGLNWERKLDPCARLSPEMLREVEAAAVGL